MENGNTNNTSKHSSACYVGGVLVVARVRSVFANFGSKQFHLPRLRVSLRLEVQSCMGFLRGNNQRPFLATVDDVSAANIRFLVSNSTPGTVKRAPWLESHTTIFCPLIVWTWWPLSYGSHTFSCL